jgi:superfamily II DNA/RNA helicase
LHNPVRIEIARQATTAETITQLLVASPSHAAEKRETLRRLMRDSSDAKNGIIFCNRKSDVQIVWKSLEKHGFSVAALHGDMDQRARTVALDGFRAGTTQYLVASDVAARGLDIPDVSHVYNFDVPHHAEDYVHRIGRTGRAGRKGAAFTIVTADDRKSLAAVEAMIKTTIEYQGPTLDELPQDESADTTERRGPRGRSRPSGRKGDDAGHVRSPRSRAPKELDAPHVARDENDNSEVTEKRAPRPRLERKPSERHANRRETLSEEVRSERNSTADRSTFNERPQHDRRRRDLVDHEPTPKGLGDHVPNFLMKSTGFKS